LRRGRGSVQRLACLAIYVGSCILLLSVSTAYHMSQRGSAANAMLLRLDHASIFILIAGTYTPMHILLFRGWLRWGPVALIWIGAAFGVAIRTLMHAEFRPGMMIAVFLILGWLGALSAALLWRRFGGAFVRPLLLGGVAYSVGAMMHFFGWPIVIPTVIHSHDVFHIAVLTGAFYHWRFIWQFASGEVG
jgi:channel protein (hemolysin III family)